MVLDPAFNRYHRQLTEWAADVEGMITAYQALRYRAATQGHETWSSNERQLFIELDNYLYTLWRW